MFQADLPISGDHVDILGRSSLNDLILRVVGGHGHLIEENFVSQIKEYADKVKIHEEPEYETISPLDDLLQRLEEQLGMNNSFSDLTVNNKTAQKRQSK